MKKEINVFDYAGDILKALRMGVLLTTKAEDRTNVMTIGWGSIGVEWGTPVFTALVREGRFSRELLDKNGEFTVSVPYERPFDRQVLGIAGSRSGRQQNKYRELNLAEEAPLQVSTPAYRDFPLTLECRVLYRQPQELALMPEDIQQRWYPQDKGSEVCGSNKDAHIAYIAEIVAAYIVEDDE
ncbi:Flavin reductase like domain [Slackia heliotrinireducens]|nr:flavin reductase [Slackia heliotrinireducens]VEH02065.1 Flavin reductase like domain [Slackia heliotrinireducens]